MIELSSTIEYEDLDEMARSNIDALVELVTSVHESNRELHDILGEAHRETAVYFSELRVKVQSIEDSVTILKEDIRGSGDFRPLVERFALLAYRVEALEIKAEKSSLKYWQLMLALIASGTALAVVVLK